MFENFETPVRCSKDHVYTSIWVPLASFKSLRVGWRRWQRCPVGKHWAMTYRLDQESAPPELLTQAAAVHDWHIP